MCDLKTVVVAGGDVGSLGRSASSELSGLMRWAGSCGGGRGGGGGGGGVLRQLASGGRGKGVVVVIDEAEAALGDRRKKGMSENARSALNAVLLSTGELRAGFLMVLTTSRPQVNRRGVGGQSLSDGGKRSEFFFVVLARVTAFFSSKQQRPDLLSGFLSNRNIP